MRTPLLVRIAGEAALGAAVLGLASSASGQSAGTSTAGQTTPAPTQSRPARVKLDGFDLSSQGAHGGLTPAKHSGANQIGGASRGIGAIKLFAPEKGLAYSLHPTFQWSGTPDTKYKLHIENLVDHTSFDTTVEGTSFTYPETG